MRIKSLLFKVIGMVALATSTHAELALTKIADATTAVPGAPGTMFKEIGQPFLRNGQVVFYAENSSNAPGLYFYNGTNILKLADTNTASPGGGNFTNISFFAYALENGAAAFVSGYPGGTGLFFWTNGVLTRLAKSGDPIPGTATNLFTGFGQPAFDGGTLYFIGFDAARYRGIHRYDGTVSTGLVSSLQNYPGTALPHGFSSQLTVESNRLAFWTFPTNNSTDALFRYDGSANFLVSSNDVIPPAGPNFKTFQSPPDLKDGVVAFKGGSVANFQEGVFLIPIDGGAITPVARRGDPNLGTSGTLTMFDEFATENGKVWFNAGGASGSSLFLWESNALRRVLSSGMKIGSRQLASSSPFTFTQNCYDHDVAAFVGRFLDNTKTLYLVSNAPPASNSLNLTFTNIISTNTPLPGGTGFFTSIFGAFPWQGGVIFGGSGTNNQGGLYRYQNGVFSMVFDKNGLYPGSATNFSFVGTLTADATRLLIQAGGAGGQQGLFIYDGTNLTLVADLATAIPDGSFGNFISFTRAQFNGAKLTIQASGTNSYSGLFEYDGVTLTRLVDSTSPFPGGSSFLRVANFSQQGNQLGLVAFDGAGSSLQGLITYTNGNFTLIATTSATMPGRPDRAFGFFTGLGWSGGDLYFTAQAFSTVDSFSGAYLLKVPGGSADATIVLDENSYFPGLLGGMNAITLYAAPEGLFFDASNGSQRGLYRFTDGLIERLLDNNSSINGASIQLFSLAAASLSSTTAAFVTTLNTGFALFTAGLGGNTPLGGQFTPGSILYSPGGSFCVTFGGATSGSSYRVQYNTTPGSTNWVTLTNFTYTAPLTVCDPGASNQIRLYRAVSP